MTMNEGVPATVLKDWDVNFRAIQFPEGARGYEYDDLFLHPLSPYYADDRVCLHYGFVEKRDARGGDTIEGHRFN